MNALYNIVEAYSDWLYREHGEAPADLKPRTVKNFFIRIYLIVIYYPVVAPLVFLIKWDTTRRIKRCLDNCFRMAENPRTTRDDLIQALSKGYESGQEALADAILRIKGRNP